MQSNHSPTKIGQTIDEILTAFAERYMPRGCTYSTETTKQAIESLIAERERLARIDELRHVMHEYQKKVGKSYAVFNRDMQNRIDYKLQAQSGCQEAPGELYKHPQLIETGFTDGNEPDPTCANCGLGAWRHTSDFNCKQFESRASQEAA